MRTQFEITMDELGKLLTFGADFTLDTTSELTKDAHALVQKAHKKIALVLQEIRNTLTK